MGKRITELEETSQLSSGDFVMVDNDTVGDSKFDLGAMAENTYTKDDVDELLSQKFDAAYIAKLFGIKNLIPYPYITGDSKSAGGITWTVNEDGSVTANGTATDNCTFLLQGWSIENGAIPIDPEAHYVLTGCPEGGSTSSYAVCARVYAEGVTPASNTGVIRRDIGEGININASYAYISPYLAIWSGTTVSNLTFKPMLRLAFETDDSWMPYINPSIGDYLLEDGDGKDNVETFTSSDVADGSATAWTSVSALTTGEKHSSIFAKISQMFKNVRYLYKMLGTTDISSIGDGTVTGVLSTLNSKLTPTSGSPNCIKVGGICFITYTAAGLSIAGTNGTVFTLPSGYRPSAERQITALAVYGGASGVYRFNVATNGEVKTNVGSNTITAVYMQSVAFPL